MSSRRLVPGPTREALLGLPSDIASLERNYPLAIEDLALIGTRRRPENRLGLAIHIALLRHGPRGRGAFRARRVGGQRIPVRPARAPCRYRRGLGPRLRPVSPARPLARASPTYR